LFLRQDTSSDQSAIYLQADTYKQHMKVFHSIISLKQWLSRVKHDETTTGFVPTMGALHAGHLALVSRARAENHKVVCSIFVNPIQFNNPEDLKKYPRTLEQDLEMLRSVGCDAVFCPDEAEMYPEPEQQVYDFGTLERVMEGRFRPGHFNGVAIVVKKLFDIVQPHRAYFGEKDFQQLQVIRALVEREKLPVEIVPCPTMRDPDGLAMSSRNARLTPEQRQEAPKIFQSLQQAKGLFPITPLAEIREWVGAQINQSPLMKLEYFDIVDAQTLLPLDEAAPGQQAVACIAVHMGPVRLIDNMFFN
jgi:pantoate--beta-alanine ligase